MDAYVAALPAGYDPFWTAPHPRDRRLQPVVAGVEGMATENKLWLLNCAAAHGEPGEVYLEVGTWKGLSIIGAMQGNDAVRFVAIDDFSEFGGTRAILDANLARFGCRERLAFHEGDFGAVLARGVVPPRSVGVYFFDGLHQYDVQFRGLRVIEPWLADRACVIVDDTAWARVRDANLDYVAHHPAWRLVFDIPSATPGEPCWWNGVQVFDFDRRRGAPGPMGRVRRAWRHLRGRLRHERVLGVRWGLPGRRHRHRE